MDIQLIDQSPPDGDFVRYIDQLMERSQAAATMPNMQKGQSQVAPSPGKPARKARPAAPGQTEGPPELAELLRKVFNGTGMVPSAKSKGMPVVAVWWIWAAVALIVAGVFFPVGIGWIVIIAFVLWRISKAAAAAKGRKA